MIIVIECFVLVVLVIVAFLGFKMNIREDVNDLSAASGFTLSMFTIVGIVIVFIDLIRRIL